VSNAILSFWLGAEFPLLSFTPCFWYYHVLFYTNYDTAGGGGMVEPEPMTKTIKAAGLGSRMAAIYLFPALLLWGR
jgi:hypothetical protein